MLNKYKLAFQKYKGGIKSLKWISYSSAAQRYKQIIKDINFENKKILDVGCGFEDILPFIKAKTDKFEFKLGDYFVKPLDAINYRK